MVSAARSHVGDRPHTPDGDPAADRRIGRDLWFRFGVVSRSADEAITARTRFIDGAVVDALAAGVDQFVVVGAGDDVRPVRFRAPGVHWLELDPPDTQVDKRRRLFRLRIDATGVGFAPADFRTDDIATALVRAGLD